MDAKMGGPHETGSIHWIWTEGGKTHIKIAKLDLSVLQIQAHDQNHPHKAMSETNLLQDAKMPSFPLDTDHGSLRARYINLFLLSAQVS